MLSVVHGPPPAPCPAPFNLAAHVLAAGTARPDRSALQILRPTGAERWSHARLRAAVLGAARMMRDRGLAPGDRVLLRLGNGPAFPVAFLGAVAADLVPVPTSALLTEPEVALIAAETRPGLVLADPGIALPPDSAAAVVAGAEVLAAQDGPALDPVPGDPDRPAYIVYTSGSSGRPRAVVHAHRAVWARRMMWQGWYGLGPEDRLLHAGSFNWTYTMGTGLMDPWAAGATALIPAPGLDPAALPLLLRRFDATIFASSPGIYRRILRQHDRLDLPRLRHGLSAGESLPGTLRAAWQAATGRAVYEALGMTECSTFVSAAPGRPAPPGAIGWPQPGRSVAVLGPDGAPVPRGAPGILAVHRDDPGLFLGYLGAPEETAARYSGAWFVTGDTVTMAEDGAIAYLGRDDDMMNAGGIRVSPLEIEAAMAACPGAGEVAAVEVEVRPGVRVIGLAHTGPAQQPALAAHAETCLARYKQPRLYRPLPALPQTATGKIDRRALRKTWEASP